METYKVVLEFTVESDTYEKASEIVDKACQFDHEDESLWLKISSVYETSVPPKIISSINTYETRSKEEQE